MPRRIPFRADNLINQQFGDGELTVYATNDGGAPGRMPVVRFTPMGLLRYEEQRVGLQRYYSAKQDNVLITKVVRCPWKNEVSPQDAVILTDGFAYRIEQKQQVRNVWPESMDLSLSAYAQKYEVDEL